MTIIPYTQDIGGFQLLKGEDKKYFDRYLACISALINNDEVYEKLTLAWAKYFYPEFAPFFDNINSNPEHIFMRFIRNAFTCEGHNEVMTTYYKAHCAGDFGAETDRYIEMIQKLQNYEIINL